MVTGTGGHCAGWLSCPWGAESPSERKLVKAAGDGGSGGGGAVGRVWGSQSHPVVAKLGSQQIPSEDVFCVRRRDAGAFRDTTSHPVALTSWEWEAEISSRRHIFE